MTKEKNKTYSETMFRDLLENAPLGYQSLDKDGIIIYINKAWEDFFGYTKKEVVGTAFISLLPDDQKKHFERCFSELIREKEIHDAEFEMAKKDGSLAIVSFDGKIGVDRQGNLRTHCTFHDVTQRRRTEQALKRSEEKYRTLFQVESDAVFLIDEETADILDANASAVAMYGYTKKELLTLKAMDLSAEPEKTRKIINSKSDTHIPLRYHRKKDGTVFPVEIHARDYALFGKRINISTVRDITEKIHAENEIKKSQQQLRDLARHLQTVREEEKAMIAREVHDELGQVLSALKMDISWVRNKLPKHLRELYIKLQSIIDLTDQSIQTVKRISSELRPSLLDVLGLVPTMEWQAEQFQSRHNITCKLSLDKRISPGVELSITLFRCLQEALTNVARHADADQVDVNFYRSNNDIILHIQDNGKGITDAQIKDPRSYGLIGMRERVDAFGGRFYIERKQPAGTSVKIIIPSEETEKNDGQNTDR